MVGAETPDDCVWNEKSNKLKLLLLLLSPSFIPFWLVTFVIKAPVVGEARTLAEEETKAGESRKREGLKQVEGETREGEIEIEEGAKDLNFGISRSSKEEVDVLPDCCDQLAEPFMFCLVLLLSIVRKEAAIRKMEVCFIKDQFQIYIERRGAWRRRK